MEVFNLTEKCPNCETIGSNPECSICQGTGLKTTENGYTLLRFIELNYRLSSRIDTFRMDIHSNKSQLDALKMGIFESDANTQKKIELLPNERQAKLRGIMSWLPHNQKTAERELIEALIEYIGNDDITAFFESLKKEMRWD